MGRAARAAALGIRADRSRDPTGYRADKPQVSIGRLDVEEAAPVDCDAGRSVHRQGDSVGVDMAVIIGLAGASRNGAVAVCDEGRVVGMCEHERVTRTRREALTPGRLPTQTLETILKIGSYRYADVETYAVAEPS